MFGSIQQRVDVLGAVIGHIEVVARIADGEMKFGADQVLTMPELMDGLTASIWSELRDGRNITSMRRNLQRVHMDRMTTILTTPPARMPADARSVARMQLRSLKQQVTRALGGNLDVYTRAHLTEVSDHIDHALEAGLEVRLRGRG